MIKTLHLPAALLWAASSMLLCYCTTPPAAQTHASTKPGQPRNPSNPDNAVPEEPPHCILDTPSDIHITVTAQRGPHGAPAPVPISNKLYSMNIADQFRGDYVPKPEAQFTAYLKALRPGLLRWPAGFYSQKYHFSRSGQGPTVMTPALVDAFMALCRAVDAKPFLGINIETDGPSNASELVRYVNVEKGYGVTWWQLGNEPDVNGWDHDHTPENYAGTYLQFAQAIQAVDPNIRLVGAELMSGQNIMGTHQSMDWLTPMLNIAGKRMDAVGWHYYPLYSGDEPPEKSAYVSPWHLIQETAPDWPPAGLDFASQIFPALAAKRQKMGLHFEIWVDEFAEDPGSANGQGVADRVVGALWAADAIGRFAEYGADALFHFIFKAGSNFSYTLLDANNNPRPEYYTYWLYAQHFGDKLVASTSDKIWQVSAHAALRSEDGSLRVMLVNKMDKPKTARLYIQGYSPHRAVQYTLLGNRYGGTDVAINGQKLSVDNLEPGPHALASQPADACTDTVLTLPPFSVKLLVFRASS